VTTASRLVISRRSFDGQDHRLVERLDQQRRPVFQAWVAGLALLEPPVHRRLAAADLVIALFWDMGLPILSPRAARATPLPYCHSEVPHYLAGQRNYQLKNYHVGK